MTNTDLAQRYAATMRRDTTVPGMVREASACTVRYTHRRGSLRFVLWHRFSAADLERVVSDEIALARQHAGALVWRVHADDEPAGLGAHLLERGFRHDATSVQHFSSAEHVAAVTRDHGCPFAIRELTRSAELDAYLPIWNEAWPDAPNERYVRDYQGALDDGVVGMRFWAAFDDAQPIAAAYVIHPPGHSMALLCGGVTRKAWQRRGAYRALLHARATAALAAGADTLCVDASPQAARALQPLGFEPQVQVDFYELDFEAAGRRAR
jgi:GNAT superfamily N-acetyltransferase